MPPLPKTDKIAPSRPTRQQRPPSASSISFSASAPSTLSASSMPPSAVASPPTPTSVRLSMPVSPTEVGSLSRPAAPRIRSKRMSAATPPPRSSPAPRPRSLHHKDEPAGSSASSTRTVERYTGSIVDRTEDELALASRDALQDALRKAWSDREQFMARIDELDTAQRSAELQAANEANAHETLHQKFDSLYNEQGALEAELEQANEVVEHLRANLQESDRQNRQGQRRYVDQEKAFEAERLVHQAENQHLQQRIKSLMTERIARPGNDDSHAALQEELVTLTASHQTLVAQLTTIADEMHEVKADNARLQEENESWQLLIEDRTLAGTMRGGLLSPLKDQPTRVGSPSSAETNALATLEEQMEMDELNNELDDAQSYFDQELNPLQRHLSPSKANGLSLALEISAAPQIAEIEALKSEVKGLKEANRALSLYCSKILDRIMAHEGFEQVLSTDYRTRRFGTRSANGIGKGRPSAEEMARAIENGAPAPAPAPVPEPVKAAPAPTPVAEPAPAPAPAAAPPAALPRRGRPQSMMVTSQAQQPLPKHAELKKEVGEKRARRGFSIDFRSLGFGSAEPKPEPKPQLKPLQLASRAAPANSHPHPHGNASPPKPTVAPLVVASARKLEPQEEDDEDRRERHRMEAALKLMGIDKSASPSAETSPLPGSQPDTPIDGPQSSANGAGNWFSRRISRAASNPVPSPSTTPIGDRRDSSTPLARLSQVIGTTDPVLAGLVDLSDPRMEDPDLAAAALRAYDEREKEQVRLISEGKNQTAFTSPPKLSSRRSTTSRPSSGSASSVSPTSITDSGRPASITGPPNGHRKLDSISTLWSMGSSRASLDHDRGSNDNNPPHESINKVIRVAWDETENGVTKRHTHTAIDVAPAK